MQPHPLSRLWAKNPQLAANMLAGRPLPRDQPSADRSCCVHAAPTMPLRPCRCMSVQRVANVRHSTW
jgi:hypothetical protein